MPDDHALSYVDTVNSNLICSICQLPFTLPTVTITCSHTFCQSCIRTALAYREECPVDRSSLTLNDLQPANTIIRNLVDELLVHCPNSSLGCTHICQRQLMRTHLTHDCLYVATRCCEDDCNTRILRKDADKHAQTCPHRIVTCDACETRIKFTDLQIHNAECPAAEWICTYCQTITARSDRETHLSSCELVTVDCEHAQYGCSWRGKRNELSAHITTCAYEGLKGFFAMHTSRVLSLEAENAALRSQLEELRINQDAMRRDVQSARSSLGPWLRSADSQPPPQAPTQSRPERVIQRRRMSVPLSTASFGHPFDPVEDSDTGIRVHSTTTVDERSFPSDNDWPSSTISDFSPSQNDTTHQPRRALSPDMPYPRISSYSHAQTWVAPIDLTTSLEGCLTSLRNSIVNIATALDSQERRQDIALATETLRMHEEVASLRAIVQGLRMQVHFDLKPH
ncbi:uncharacterized protein EI90DRAFT_2920692 [Cantharellus anzutake]|uniref:uncharacterized protein n=1 Tax=Cantharellus anzutake TaxID=1750568 RepID=UPI0019087D1E|nr:uncharacterized protein EI90DRAFT_2920692 [Cantharellus anzutake]KAF8331112.1 hypothetical protein EI90DRAFT_2920692 [Cantharellus anzutake]